MKIHATILEQRVAKKQHVDLSRANFLIAQSNNSFPGLRQIIRKIGINELNTADIIKNSYDAVKALIRANF